MRMRFAGLLLGLLPLAAGAQTLPEQIVELTNIARWERGQLPPLKLNAQLASAAQGHSTAMGQRNFFMHCDPDTGKQFGTRITEAGYSYSSAAENIAAGRNTAAGTMDQWLNSQGHLTNLLGNYTELGVGYYNDTADTNNVRRGSGCTVSSSSDPGSRHYWTQNFGRRGAVLLVVAREAYQVNHCTADLYTHASGQAQMRFSNDGSTWSAWETFAANKIWTLAGALGSQATVSVQTRTSGGATTTATDTVRLGVACGTAGSPPPATRVFAGSFE